MKVERGICFERRGTHFNYYNVTTVETLTIRFHFHFSDSLVNYLEMCLWKSCCLVHPGQTSVNRSYKTSGFTINSGRESERGHSRFVLQCSSRVV